MLPGQNPHEFIIFNAPYEYLSTKDFKQGDFQNKFFLVENGNLSEIAIAGSRELTVIRFQRNCEFSPKVITPECCNDPMHSDYFQADVNLSLCSMKWSEYFNLAPFHSYLKFDNMYLYQTKKHLIFGLIACCYASCIMIPKVALVRFKR